MLINFFVSGSDLILAASEEKLPRALGKIFCLVRPQKNLSPFDNAKVRNNYSDTSFLIQNLLLIFVNATGLVPCLYPKRLFCLFVFFEIL